MDVNIKTRKGPFIAHKFPTGWSVGVMRSVENKESVAGQFAVKYKPESYCSTKKLNKEDSRQLLGTSYCCKRFNNVKKQ